MIDEFIVQNPGTVVLLITFMVGAYVNYSTFQKVKIELYDLKQFVNETIANNEYAMKEYLQTIELSMKDHEKVATRFQEEANRATVKLMEAQQVIKDAEDKMKLDKIMVTNWTIG